MQTMQKGIAQHFLEIRRQSVLVPKNMAFGFITVTTLHVKLVTQTKSLQFKVKNF